MCQDKIKDKVSLNVHSSEGKSVWHALIILFVDKYMYISS